MGVESPKSFPGKSAAKSLVSSNCTGTHLKASEISFLDRRTLANGKRCFHHRIDLAISEWRGCRAGGWFSLAQVRFTTVASHMTRPLVDNVRSGSIFGTRAMGTDTTPASRSDPWSSAMRARPFRASFQSCPRRSSRVAPQSGFHVVPNCTGGGLDLLPSNLCPPSRPVFPAWLQPRSCRKNTPDFPRSQDRHLPLLVTLLPAVQQEGLSDGTQAAPVAAKVGPDRESRARNAPRAYSQGPLHQSLC